MDSSQWRMVARESDVAEGGLKLVEAGDEKIILTRRDGQVFALGHMCPHYQEKLEKGLVVAGEIICKSHQARFDVRTGRMTSPPARDGLPATRQGAGRRNLDRAGRPPPMARPGARSLPKDRRTFLILGPERRGAPPPKRFEGKGSRDASSWSPAIVRTRMTVRRSRRISSRARRGRQAAVA